MARARVVHPQRNVVEVAGKYGFERLFKDEGRAFIQCSVHGIQTIDGDTCTHVLEHTLRMYGNAVMRSTIDSRASRQVVIDSELK